MNLPENLLSVHTHEEAIWLDGILALRDSPDHCRHLSLTFLALDLLHVLTLQPEPVDQDHLLVQLLGIRVANSLLSAAKLAISGYAQAGVMLLRDTQETTWLLEEFGHHPQRRSEWRNCSDRIRRKSFRPALIRKALDLIEEDNSGRRDHRYALLCELGAHPSFRGIELTRQAGGLATWGPFHREDLLKAVVEDLAWVALESAIVYARHFSYEGIDKTKLDSSFLAEFKSWAVHFFGSKYADEKSSEQLWNAVKIHSAP